ncbi:HNH endonuclease [Rhizobium hidalgonense]|uniref:HNH endonuclease n=1 Tax=Rhizobium hidalgonense TaxID=1538159 RepID=UPI0028718B3A|nr:HNH endonuclease [Rhizobium hidalgonense]MDR9813105.1 HNH endonuclease [Rhizobium hidalgonense]
MRTVIIHEGISYRAYDHIYAVSACGRFLKIKTLSPCTPLLRQDGYLSVGRQRLAHRVVATCWVAKPDGADHVHHINRDKTDNRAENLEWVSQREHNTVKHKGSSGHYVRTEITKQKLRDYRTGRQTEEATKQKQREAALRLGLKPPPRPVGSKCSNDAVEKMRINSPNARGCVIDGVVYRSFSEAGRALNEKPHTLRKRCLSSSFGNYALA